MSSLPSDYDALAVETHIVSLFFEQNAQLDQKVAQAGTVLLQTQQAGVECVQKIRELDARAADADSRMAERVNEVNALKAAIEKIHADASSEFEQVRATQQVSEEESEANVDSKIAHLVEKMVVKFRDLEAHATKEVATMHENLRIWTEQFERSHLTAPPGIGDTLGMGHGRRAKSSLDKKDLAVWRLEDNVDKLKFRHWIEAVENNLEQVHGWDRAAEVLDRVRRQTAEVDQKKLESIVDDTHTALFDSGEKALDRSSYEFETASRMLYSFLINKVNTDMHERASSVEKKNGFELYRIIYNAIDPIAVNATFACDQAIMSTGHEFAGKIKDLKGLYEFRVLLKRKVTEYKKIVGRDPDHELLKNILFSVMDTASKQHIADFALDVVKNEDDGHTKISMYKTFCEDIDKRYKLQYGTLGIRTKKADLDDPMGIHAVTEAPREDGPPNTAAEAGGDSALDAVGKGKGKGKGDGRCRVCNGEGHFARDCPSTEPVAPQAIECHGCHGRGHVKGQCPTANPHLKVTGANKGWGKGWGGGSGAKGAGGKGWGGKGAGGWGGKGKGKGKGGKGGGLSEIDVMGGSWNNDWSNDWGGSGNGDWGSAYLRSLATLTVPNPVIDAKTITVEKSFESENRFAVFTEDVECPKIEKPGTFQVPLADFIRPNRAPGKARRLVTHKVAFAKKSECSQACDCDPKPIDSFEVRTDLTSASAPNRVSQGVATPAAWPQHAKITHPKPEDNDEENVAEWKDVEASRRGGRWRSGSLSSSSKISDKCHQDRHRPSGSVTTGRVGTDEGSPKGTTDTRRTKAPLQPKPSNDLHVGALLKLLEQTLSSASNSSNAEILVALKQAGQALASSSNLDYWLTDAGQTELLRKYESDAKPPSSGSPRPAGLYMFEVTYTETRASVLVAATGRAGPTQAAASPQQRTRGVAYGDGGSQVGPEGGGARSAADNGALRCARSAHV